jgi:hypothetical protein
MPAGIKLGPAFDRARIPEAAEAQWISVDGSTIELVVWTGTLARAGVRRSALVVRSDRAAELTAPSDAPRMPRCALGAFVHEPEGAVIRARLIGEVARRLDAGMLAPGIAYLTSDAESRARSCSPSASARAAERSEGAPAGAPERRSARWRSEARRRCRPRDIPTQLKLKVRARDAHPHACGTSRIALLAERVTG